MKLPKEVLAAMRIKPDGVTPFTDLFAEAIVRDCAKVCEQQKNAFYDPIVHTSVCAQAILSRYGLTEKEPK